MATPAENSATPTDPWSARTADELHAALVLGDDPYGRRGETHDAFELLIEHHRAEPGTSVATATLLLTSVRWRKGAGDLARRIAGSDILEPAVLDLLAEAFVTANEFVYWRVPDSWFGDDAVEVVLDAGADPADSPPDAAKLPDVASAEPIVTRRPVHPGVRRWAAAHIVARDPSVWSQLCVRAREMDRRGGTALMGGLLDAIAVLTPAAQQLVIDTATGWPNAAVRRTAFRLIADRDGPQAIIGRALNDADAQIRSWARTLREADEDTEPTGQLPLL